MLSHAIWFAGLLAITIYSVITGASAFGAGLVMVIGSLPAIVFFCLRGALESQRGDSLAFNSNGFAEKDKLPATDAENLLVITWLLMSICLAGFVAPGRSTSGLVVILAPLMALVIGRRALVRETAAFALIVSVSFLALHLTGTALPGLANISQIEAPLSVLVVSIGLVMVLLVAQGASDADEAAQRKFTQMEAQARRGQTHVLIEDAPWLMVQVSEYGRIRSVIGGDDVWWPDLVAGAPIHTVFPELYEALHTGSPASTPLGDRVYVKKARLNDGSYSILLAPDDSRDTHHAPQSLTLDQSDWLLGLSHDLKSPLNAILGFSEIMMVEQFGPLPERYAKYPAMIHKSGAQLQGLINDIMDLSKTGADKYEIEQEAIDLTDVAIDMVEQFHHLAEQAEVEIVLSSDTPVVADADHRAVYRIWQNLISNAIKYSTAGGTVTLSSRQEGASAIIEVADTGIGMTEEDLNRIAEPFSQGKNSKGKAGTGLGLSVVRTFAELHGGKMIIDTAPNAGTRIEVHLPANQSLSKAAE